MSADDLVQLFVDKLAISDAPQMNSIEFAQQNNVEHQKVVGAVKSLQSMLLVDAEQVESKRFELTKEGQQIVAEGSHEFRLYSAVPAGGIEQPALMKCIPDANVGKLGFTKAMSNKWIGIDKASGKPMVVRKAENVVDDVQASLKALDKVSFCFSYALLFLSIN